MKTIRHLIIITVYILTLTIGCREKQTKVPPSGGTLTTAKPNRNETIEKEILAKENGKHVTVVPTFTSILNNENSVYSVGISYLWHEMMLSSDISIKNNKIANELMNDISWQNTIQKDRIIFAFGNPDSVYRSITEQARKKYKTENAEFKKQGERFWGVSYININLQYKDPFPKTSIQMGNETVTGFGFRAGESTEYIKSCLQEQYKILYYKNDSNFIVQLTPSNANDEIILVMSEFTNTFYNAYQSAKRSIQSGRKEKQTKPFNYCLNFTDELKIPKILFHTTRNYNELNGLKFSSLYPPIELTEQSILLNFDEKGAVVKDASIAVDSVGMKTPPKKLVFNRPFYLFIKESSATFPYFSMYVHDKEVLIKKEGE